jgi:hypothetical protein
MGAEQFLPVKTFAFPVDIDKFKPATQITSYKDKDKVLIYYKHRSPIELNILKEFLAIQAIKNYKIFDYNKKYEENDYLSYLKQCKYGIILDAHESQGFAIEEALACDVPLLVWNAQTMNQELNSQYAPIPCTSIPYWDERCGEYFHHQSELPSTFKIFQDKLHSSVQHYKPREYILENLSIKKCSEDFINIIS